MFIYFLMFVHFFIDAYSIQKHHHVFSTTNTMFVGASEFFENVMEKMKTPKITVGTHF